MRLRHEREDREDARLPFRLRPTPFCSPGSAGRVALSAAAGRLRVAPLAVAACALAAILT